MMIMTRQTHVDPSPESSDTVLSGPLGARIRHARQVSGMTLPSHYLKQAVSLTMNGGINLAAPP